MRTPMKPAGSGTDDVADRPRAMNPVGHVFWPHTEALCAVQREIHVVNVWNVSCSSSVAAKIARASPGTVPRPADFTASKSDANVVSAAAGEPDGAGSRIPRRIPAAMRRTVPAAIKNAACIPSVRPSIRKAIAPTHIWKVTDPVASERCRDGTASATSAWNGARAGR